MEIKSRGYDRDTKRWYYGGYFKHQIKEICPVQFSDETAADKEPKYEHYIVFDGFADWNMAKPIKLATVDPKSVGVYIGQKDIKGKEIYGGDIVKVWYDNKSVNGVIKYHEENACYLIYVKQYNRHLQPFSHPEMEVVGNMYDNPELLEVED